MEELQQQSNDVMNDMLNIASHISAQVSTITISITTDKEFDLTIIKEEFNSLRIQDFIYDITGNRNSIVISNKRRFNNSIIFKCYDVPTNEEGYVLNKQAVKVFCNGSIHITGVKHINDALYLVEVFTTMIELIYRGDGISGMFCITGFDIQLMNFYFKLPKMDDNRVLKLVDVLQYLRQNTNFAVSYNNERHAGIIIRSPTFALLIFDTGNVIICSIKDASQLLEAREFIEDKIYLLSDRFCITKEPTSKRRRKENVDFDYAKYLVLK